MSELVSLPSREACGDARYLGKLVRCRTPPCFLRSMTPLDGWLHTLFEEPPQALPCQIWVGMACYIDLVFCDGIKKERKRLWRSNAGDSML